MRFMAYEIRKNNDDPEIIYTLSAYRALIRVLSETCAHIAHHDETDKRPGTVCDTFRAANGIIYTVTAYYL